MYTNISQLHMNANVMLHNEYIPLFLTAMQKIFFFNIMWTSAYNEGDLILHRLYIFFDVSHFIKYGKIKVHL